MRHKGHTVEALILDELELNPSFDYDFSERERRVSHNYFNERKNFFNAVYLSKEKGVGVQGDFCLNKFKYVVPRGGHDDRIEDLYEDWQELVRSKDEYCREIKENKLDKNSKEILRGIKPLFDLKELPLLISLHYHMKNIDINKGSLFEVSKEKLNEEILNNGISKETAQRVQDYFRCFKREHSLEEIQFAGENIRKYGLGD